VGLVALATIIPLASDAVSGGSTLSKATFLAQQRIEEIRSAAWAATPAPIDCLGVSVNGAPESTTCGRTRPTPCALDETCVTFPDEPALPGDAAGYSRTVRITSCGTGEGCAGVVNPNLRRVEVTVVYEGGGQRRSTTALLELLVSRRE
jgi:hypothetical protein